MRDQVPDREAAEHVHQQGAEREGAGEGAPHAAVHREAKQRTGAAAAEDEHQLQHVGKVPGDRQLCPESPERTRDSATGRRGARRSVRSGLVRPRRLSVSSTVSRRTRFAILACACLLACGRSGDERLPTLVLVTLDTLNERHLGFFGYDEPTSPHLDAWLAESLVFEEMQTAAPWTLPSVASLMTGLPYSLHGAGNVRVGEKYDLTPVRGEVPMLAELLRERGYRTTAIVANPYFDPRRSLGIDRGFDRYYVFDGKDRNQATRDALAALDPQVTPRATLEGEGLAEHLVALFERALRPEDESGAFYWIHFLDAHNPYVQRDAVLARNGLPRPDARDGTLWLDWEQRRAMKREPGGFDAAAREGLVRAYDGEVAYLDAALGRLFAKLDAALPEDAWTLVTTDHGEEVWEHGRVDHDHTMYQELLGTFVGLRGPGIEPARDRTLVRHVDVFATLCALGGAACPRPATPAADFVGIDLLDAEAQRPPHAVSENNLTNPMLAAIRDGERKLIVRLGDGDARVFDLVRDPGEQAPADSAVPGLRAKLDALHRIAGRPVVVARPRDPALEERLRALGYVE